jgi:predicted DNA-binding transcriptional regulator YafY
MADTPARLLTLLSLLQTRRDWPGGTLAGRLEVSTRTVRRDVDRLRELGYPVHASKGPDGGYRLEPGADLPPLLFDDEQAIAVAVALQTATTSVTGIEEGALRALATVRQVMPARLRGRVDALQVTAVQRGGREHPRVDTDDLMAVGSAVRAREILRFDYATPGPDTQEVRPPRRVEPHHLVTWGGRWYLVAWDLERRDWRTFRVDRMTTKSPAGPRFSPRELPGRDVADYITTQFGGRQEWPCQGEVILHAPASLASPWVRGGGFVEALSPQRCRLMMGSWSWESLAASMGLFGADFDIVGPAELREAAGRLSRRFTDAAS